MYVKKLVKTEQGEVLFEGTLSQEEHEIVVAIGLNQLFEQGCIPFTQDDNEVDFFPPIDSAVN